VDAVSIRAARVAVKEKLDSVILVLLKLLFTPSQRLEPIPFQSSQINLQTNPTNKRQTAIIPTDAQTYLSCPRTAPGTNCAV
jgi:hypothetical protein